jgi:hypothetical protein
MYGLLSSDPKRQTVPHNADDSGGQHAHAQQKRSVEDMQTGKIFELAHKILEVHARFRFLPKWARTAMGSCEISRANEVSDSRQK